MTDKVTRLPTKPRVVSSDNLRPADSDTLATMGQDASVWPHGGDYARRVREARDRAKPTVERNRPSAPSANHRKAIATNGQAER